MADANNGKKKKKKTGVLILTVIIAAVLIGAGVFAYSKYLKPIISYNSIKKAETGETVKYGHYNGKDIEWLVLKKENGKVMLISKYILDNRPFHTSLTKATWNTCSLNKWLNESFYDEAFDETERSNIYGNITILTIEEVREFFPSDYDKKCTYADGKVGFWWLRTSGRIEYYGPCVHNYGHVTESGASITKDGGVRPVIWIYTES